MTARRQVSTGRTKTFYLSRRSFLKSAAAVAGVSPMILHAADKSGSKAPVLGTGAFQYEVVSHSWGASFTKVLNAIRS